MYNKAAEVREHPHHLAVNDMPRPHWLLNFADGFS
jgi:hypothetical protein